MWKEMLTNNTYLFLFNPVIAYTNSDNLKNVLTNSYCPLAQSLAVTKPLYMWGPFRQYICVCDDWFHSPSSALEVLKYDFKVKHPEDYLIYAADRYHCTDLQWCMFLLNL